MLTQKKIPAVIPAENVGLPLTNPDKNIDMCDLVDAFNVLSRWKCTDEAIRDLLGFKSEDAYLEMLLNPKGYPFTNDQTLRMRYIINIDRALNILLSKNSADSWVYRPNYAPLFKGKPAIQFMQSGTLSDFKAVSEYLYGNIFL